MKVFKGHREGEAKSMEKCRLLRTNPLLTRLPPRTNNRAMAYVPSLTINRAPISDRASSKDSCRFFSFLDQRKSFK